MADYTTYLPTWGSTGVAPPSGYAYAGEEQPVDAFDNFVVYNQNEDIKYLVGLTNDRLESGLGSSYPASPENGELFWNTGTQTLELYDDAATMWKGLAFDADLTAHATDTANPHSVTAAQAGAIEDATGTVDETHLSFDTATQAELDAHATDTANPHNTDATQVGALPIVGGTMSGKIDMSQFDICNVVVDPLAADPTEPTQGQIWFRTDTGTWHGYNGTSTVQFSTV
ncbi:hypothetical protein [Halapricum desulfuricans]|uniref:Uncharacterized protein n=1 Tax=Halapricum desulfuricans TaxID=2841257 RepID=A0A897N148_9EURY|nr:hypothetical protein [Halapricum desulfuricans]QSG06414.1 hypothetical protein HSR121_2082 [Halapricum desulfuricans]